MTIKANLTEYTKQDLDLCDLSFALGQEVLGNRSRTSRKDLGQFLTPVSVARFMAHRLGTILPGARILDPAIGSGVLATALIESAIRQGDLNEFSIVGYEIDPELLVSARSSLQHAVDTAALYGLKVRVHLYEANFVSEIAEWFKPATLFNDERAFEYFAAHDLIIANPPYFKLSRSQVDNLILKESMPGHTNIYTVFMAACTRLLAPNGSACFIIPRSFCSGTYFSKFRQEFWAENSITSFHVFDSRADTFRSDEVLQESVIVKFKSRNQGGSYPAVSITHSRDAAELSKSDLTGRQISGDRFIGKDQTSFVFRLPVSDLDEVILSTVDGWTGTLKEYGFEVSTGPVVPFRSRDLIHNDLAAVESGKAVPLLWMNHILPQSIHWPNGSNKPQAITLNDESAKLLVDVQNFVITRRFSAKEERRRLIAAPFLAAEFDLYSLQVGLENHLNYVYRAQGHVDEIEAIGLSALLNSSLVDRYIRISNGLTQINATELRALPLPSLDTITAIGTSIQKQAVEAVDIDKTVYSVLCDLGYLPQDFPLFMETRFNMEKIQEAQFILKELGLPPAQQNEISALTLLVLAQLSEDSVWSNTERKSMRIHDILIEIKERYDREYAENTRETIRRQVIHQFEQAGLVWRNPDEPDLPTNSPRTHYTLTDSAISVLRQFDSPDWGSAVENFQADHGALLDIYRKDRSQFLVPLRLANGEAYHLSPGQHNELQVAIVEEFGPRFAPGAKVLYLGDTANKTLIFEEETLQHLGVQMAGHEKLPDVILYDEGRQWLFLIEAVTSHGPISPKRYVELEEMFLESQAGIIYVTAFPDFHTFKTFLADIAWETEVWLAEIPDHMIHFNGDKFIGPQT